MKKIFNYIVCLLCVFCISGCGALEAGAGSGQTDKTLDNVSQKKEMNTKRVDNTMRFLINDREIPVIWEDNEAVKELAAESSKGAITVSMSMYSDNEQVGSLGKRYTSRDKQVTTQNGDIVLYNSSNIVVFYGSNTWAYTRLGKMDLSEAEVTELLSKGNVKVTLARR